MNGKQFTAHCSPLIYSELVEGPLTSRLEVKHGGSQKDRNLYVDDSPHICRGRRTLGSVSPQLAPHFRLDYSHGPLRRCDRLGKIFESLTPPEFINLIVWSDVGR